MKKWMIFGGGVITGIVLTFLFLFIYAKAGGSEDVKLFDKPGEVIESPSFEVFQVIDESVALVHGKGDSYSFHTGAVYVLTNDEGKLYYDDEIVKVPEGKVARQVGIFKYRTPADFEKTVPIVKIMDK
jgi:hypothetical protein